MKKIEEKQAFQKFIDSLPEDAYLKEQLKELPDLCFVQAMSDLSEPIVEGLRQYASQLQEKDREITALKLQIASLLEIIEICNDRLAPRIELAKSYL
jgi:hypothetical protein